MTRDVLAGAERHPWNVAFEFALPSGPPRTLTADQVAAYARDGYVTVDELLAPADLGVLVAELDEYEAQVDRFLARQDGGRVNIAEQGAITFSIHAVLQSDAARATARHPTTAGIAADLLGPDVNLYWDQAVYKKTEKPRSFPWHQDTGYTFVEPQAYLTCWLALTDATIDNGCPWIVPGVHRLGTLRHRWVEPIGWQCLDDPPGAVAAPVPAGGAVVFSSLTPHSTGPNTTDATRKAYILQYAVAGTHVLEGDPREGPPSGRVPQDDPGRQFPVLRDGRPVVR